MTLTELIAELELNIEAYEGRLEGFVPTLTTQVLREVAIMLIRQRLIGDEMAELLGEIGHTETGCVVCPMLREWGAISGD